MLLALRNDAKLLAFTLLCLVAEVMFLLGELRVIPLHLTWISSEAPVVGHVIEQKNTLNLRSRGSLSWYPSITGDVLHLNDSLMTTEDSTAILDLEGTGTLTLGPHTFLTLSRSGTSKEALYSVNIVHGEVKVSPKAKPIELKVQRKPMRVSPGTQITVKTTALPRVPQITVQEGTFELPESLKVDSPPAPAVSRTLAFQANTPGSSEKIFLKQEMERITFEWEGVAPDHIEISNASSFENPERIDVIGRRAEAALKPGKYFWRLVEEASHSESSVFVLVAPLRYTPKLPLPGQTLGAKANVRFEWQSDMTDLKYQLQVSSTADFSQLVSDQEVNGHTFESKPLAPGKYFWRLKGSHPDWGEWPASEGYSFSVKEERLSPPVPKGIKILEDHSWLDWLIPSAHAASPKESNNEVNVEADWEPVKGAHQYTIQVSETEDFKKVLLSAKTHATSIRLHLPIREKIYWRVASEDAKGERGEFSAPSMVLLKNEAEKAKKVAVKVAVAPMPSPSPTPEPPPATSAPPAPESPFTLRLGAQAAYQVGRVENPSYEVRQKGLSLNRYLMEVEAPLWSRRFTMGLFFQNMKYTSDRVAQSDLEHSYYGGEAVLRGSLFAFGLRGERILDTPLAATIDTSQKWEVSVLGGLCGLSASDDWLWRWEVLAQLSPSVAGVTAVALRTSSAVGYRIGPLIPEWTLGFYPRYGKIDSRTDLRLLLFTNVAIGIEWEPL